MGTSGTCLSDHVRNCTSGLSSAYNAHAISPSLFDAVSIAKFRIGELVYTTEPRLTTVALSQYHHQTLPKDTKITFSGMLRLAFTRSATVARTATCARATVSPRLVQQLRHESTKPSEERKEALESRNNIQRDWAAPVITYEELKPKTLQPSPVCLFCEPTRRCISHLSSGQILD